MKVHYGLESESRGQMVMACGTGKTLVGLRLCEFSGYNDILVLTPSINLVSQTLSYWCSQSRRPFDYIAVCSDSTVYNGADRALHSALHMGVPVTTDPEQIARFLSTHRQADGKPVPRVVFDTYQSSEAIVQAQARAGKQFDIALCDEAHRCAGLMDREFSAVLDDDRIAARKKLFMTATRRIYSPGAKARLESQGKVVADMKDADVFGPVLHTMSFREAINLGILADYKVVVIGVTNREAENVLKSDGKYRLGDGLEVEKKIAAAQIALLKAARRHGVTKAISFHSSRERAQHFKDTLELVAGALPAGETVEKSVKAWHLNGLHSAGKRQRTLAQFGGTGEHALSVLTNCNVLREGVDVPSVDCVAIIDPRNSPVDVIQIIGRAIRTNGRKDKVGIILLPVIIKEGAEISSALDDPKYAGIIETIKCLGRLDPEFESALGRVGESEEPLHSSVLRDEYLAKRLLIEVDADALGRLADGITTVVVDTVRGQREISREEMAEHLLEFRAATMVLPDMDVIAEGIIKPPPGPDWESLIRRIKSGNCSFCGKNSSPKKEFNFVLNRIDRTLSAWTHQWCRTYEDLGQDCRDDPWKVLPGGLTWQELGLDAPDYEKFKRNNVATSYSWRAIHGVRLPDTKAYDYERNSWKEGGAIDFYLKVFRILKKHDLARQVLGKDFLSMLSR